MKTKIIELKIYRPEGGLKIVIHPTVVKSTFVQYSYKRSNTFMKMRGSGEKRSFCFQIVLCSSQKLYHFSFHKNQGFQKPDPKKNLPGYNRL